MRNDEQAEKIRAINSRNRIFWQKLYQRFEELEPEKRRRAILKAGADLEDESRRRGMLADIQDGSRRRGFDETPSLEYFMERVLEPMKRDYSNVGRPKEDYDERDQIWLKQADELTATGTSLRKACEKIAKESEANGYYVTEGHIRNVVNKLRKARRVGA